MSDNYRLVEGDGLVTNFFYFLWKKKTDSPTAHGSTTAGSDGNPNGAPTNVNTKDNGELGTTGSQASAAASQHAFIPDLHIPSTIIFEHNYPKAWYYPRGQDVERKLGKDIDSASILKNFCPKTAAAMELHLKESGAAAAGVPAGNGPTGGLLDSAAHGVDPMLARLEDKDFVAAYFSIAKSGRPTALPPTASTKVQKVTSNPVSPTHKTAPGSMPSYVPIPMKKDVEADLDDDENPRTVIEYMNEPQLRDFLLRRTKREDGFLQRWIWPNGKNNNVIQAVWTPHMCLVTRRKNKYAVRDARISMYERAATYEGASHLSEDSYVAAHVQWQIERICQDIIRYMHEEHRVPIRRMVIYFKVDWDSTIWFLWASSIRVQDKAQLNLTIRYVPRFEVEQEEMTSGALRGKEGGDDSNAMKAALRTSGGKNRASSPDQRFLSKQPPESLRLIHDVELGKGPHAVHYPRPPSMGPIGGLYIWGSLVDPTKADTTKKRKKQRAKKGKGGVVAQQPGNGSGGTAPKPMAPAPPPSDGTSGLGPQNTKTDEVSDRSMNSSHNIERRKSSRRRGTQSTPRIDELLRQLKRDDEALSGNTSPNRSQRLDGSALAAVRPLDNVATQLFGLTSTRPKRSPTLLWKLLQLAVMSGTLREMIVQQEAYDFIAQVQYSVYSHFLTSEDYLTIAVPPSMLRGIPDVSIVPAKVMERKFAAPRRNEWVTVLEVLKRAGLEAEGNWATDSHGMVLTAATHLPPPQTGGRNARRKSSIARQPPQSPPRTAGNSPLLQAEREESFANTPTDASDPNGTTIARSASKSDFSPPPKIAPLMTNGTLQISASEPRVMLASVTVTSAFKPVADVDIYLRTVVLSTLRRQSSAAAWRLQALRWVVLRKSVLPSETADPSSGAARPNIPQPPLQSSTSQSSRFHFGGGIGRGEGLTYTTSLAFSGDGGSGSVDQGEKKAPPPMNPAALASAASS